MADFKTHIGLSTLLGAGYGGAACALFHVPLPACMLAGGLCSVSGMLPDMDSNAGVPLRESMAFAAAFVPMMLVDRFEHLGMQPESIVLAGAVVYLLIRFGLAELLRMYTVHRGMFHSLPAAVIFGEVAFLLSPGDNVQLRIYQAGAVVIGYLSHLLLDELYSIKWYRGRIRFKRTFGTAMKVVGHAWWPTILTYLQLVILTYVALKEPGWMPQHYREKIKPTMERTATIVTDHVLR